MRLLLLTLAVAAFSLAAETVLVLTTDGRTIEGPANIAAVSMGGRRVPLNALLSLHNGAPASTAEAAKIVAGLAAIEKYQNEPKPTTPPNDALRRASDKAVEELTAIGLPVLTPLLQALKDTGQHEPRPLYRLFERLVPSEADQLDRTASLARLASGELLRGAVADFSLTVGGEKLAWSGIRRLAVRRKLIRKEFDLHSLRHCTQIEYLDTGVILSNGSLLSTRTEGFVRLSWDTDGWASDANGLTVPGPNYKTNLVDGHPFGAVVGRLGAGETPFRLGRTHSAKAAQPGRLFMAVNDNRHWQNNVGHFRVRLVAVNAYDAGVAQ